MYPSRGGLMSYSRMEQIQRSERTPAMTSHQLHRGMDWQEVEEEASMINLPMPLCVQYASRFVLQLVQSCLQANAITKNVKRVIVHRDYNAQTFENDTAILELESVIEYQQHFVPICMPSEKDIYVGSGGVPQQLHEVDVPIINNTECQQMFLKSGHIKAIRDSFICAGYAQGLKDSCEGDSGGD